MINNIIESVRVSLADLAGSVGQGASEKGLQLIEDWLQIFPELEAYGLQITSFSMSLALSPALNVELVGRHGDWSDVAIADRLKKHKGETAMMMVLTTVRTAYRLQRQTKAELRDPLILKVIVKVPPEVRVVLGQPILED